jgi:hypothetical protein
MENEPEMTMSFTPVSKVMRLDDLGKFWISRFPKPVKLVFRMSRLLPIEGEVSQACRDGYEKPRPPVWAEMQEMPESQKKYWENKPTGFTPNHE